MPNISESIEISEKKRNYLLILFSAISLLLAIFLLIYRGNFAFDRAIIYIIVILTGSSLLWLKIKRLTKLQLALVVVLGIIGIFASLLFTENYAGGEWLFHMHKGYPYSWMDGGLSIWPAVEKGTPVPEFIAQNPEVIQWSVDFPALVIDLFFWMNASIVITRIVQAILEVIKTRF